MASGTIEIGQRIMNAFSTMDEDMERLEKFLKGHQAQKLR